MVRCCEGAVVVVLAGVHVVVVTEVALWGWRLRRQCGGGDRDGAVSASGGNGGGAVGVVIEMVMGWW